MKCPFCAAPDTQVKDSRQSNDGKSIKRRRFCPACDSRFTTHERIQNREIFVVKKDGTRRIFEREKIFRAISLAARKRAISPEQIDGIIDVIINNLEQSVDSEISSKNIGSMIIDALAKLDDVAYVRFASVYHDFDNVHDFENLLKKMKKVKSQ